MTRVCRDRKSAKPDSKNSGGKFLRDGGRGDLRPAQERRIAAPPGRDQGPAGQETTRSGRLQHRVIGVACVATAVIGGGIARVQRRIGG